MRPRVERLKAFWEGLRRRRRYGHFCPARCGIPNAPSDTQRGVPIFDGANAASRTVFGKRLMSAEWLDPVPPTDLRSTMQSSRGGSSSSMLRANAAVV
jgi:hypothetical protein